MASAPRPEIPADDIEPALAEGIPAGGAAGRAPQPRPLGSPAAVNAVAGRILASPRPDALVTPLPVRVAVGGARRATASSRPCAHGEQVLLLEARSVGRAAVPLVAEPVQRLVELRFAPGAARVRLGGDGRAVPRLEVLAVVA